MTGARPMRAGHDVNRLRWWHGQMVTCWHPDSPGSRVTVWRPWWRKRRPFASLPEVLRSYRSALDVTRG